jgi:hypothetical protein
VIKETFMKRVFRSGIMAGASLLVMGSLVACSSQQDTEAPLAMEVDEEVMTVDGVPGGVTTQTADITATVSAIDYKKRSLTLEDGKGARRTFNIGPEVVNFKEIKKGDKVALEYTQGVVVYLREKGEPTGDDDNAAGVVMTAPEGSKPGAVAVGTTEITAEVTAVNLENHTATLKFPDGVSQEIPVRSDVELSKDQVGREVVMQITTAIAIDVEKL